MYTPKEFKNTNDRLTAELIERHEFATIISSSRGEIFATHLPFLLEGQTEGKPRLIAHLARANPQSESFRSDPKVKVIFQGPNSYISPRWYGPVEDESDDIPTWNYAAVHVTGQVHLLEDKHILFDFLQKLIKRHEDNWKLDLSTKTLNEMMNEIVAFEVRDLKFESKFKMSQNRNDFDQLSVIQHLSESPVPMEREVASLMHQIREADGKDRK